MYSCPAKAVAAVKMMLNADEVAFEFVQYNYLKNQTSDSIMYAALLLRQPEGHALPLQGVVPSGLLQSIQIQ